MSVTATASQTSQPEPPRFNRQPNRQPSRSQTVGSRRNNFRNQEPEIHQSEDEAIAEVQDLGARTEIEFVVKDKGVRRGEKVNLSEIFAQGSVGFQNTGASEDRMDTGKSYGGGDKQAYLQKVFGGNMKKTVMDTAAGAE